MSGPNSGVQKRIKDEQPKALYNNCHGRRLYLACSDNIKKSSQRNTQLDKIIKVELLESDDGNYSGIRVLCPTRGQSKLSLLSIINNHESLMKLWEWSLQSHMLRFDFFFGFTLGECILRNADNLRQAFSNDLSAAEEKAWLINRKSNSPKSDRMSYGLF
ncbi:Hypothetical predicted protein [Mytilus galloprovincialis]|uniref:Uncharacterized protein n=1 Tax=Mytilus galloprovincialis TaxID=29158 RepID=A0A8B6BZT1_MYTGA|nr:Hypothetical predicted protein [Mytilus galloprovincialis]